LNVIQEVRATPAGPVARRYSSSLQLVFGSKGLLWLALLPVLTVGAIARSLAVGAVDPDYWWHLTTGRWMLDHGRIPTTDPFSFTHAGQQWYAHEWLAELMLAVTNHVAGYAGNIVLTAAIATAGAWVLWRSARYYGVDLREATLLIAGSGVFIAKFFAVRPQVWAFAMLALLLHELAAHDTGCRRRLWHLPLLFAVWINVNLLAITGFVALTLYAAHRGVRWLQARRVDGGESRALAQHTWAVTLLSLAALSINPCGPGLLWFARVYVNRLPLAYRYIQEFQPLKFAGNDRWLMLGGAAAVAAVVVTMVQRRLLWPGILVLVFAIPALRAVRFTPVWALAAVPAMGWVLASLHRTGHAVQKIAVERHFTTFLAAITLIVAAGATLLGATQFHRTPNPVPGD